MDLRQVKATIDRGGQAANDGIDLIREVQDRIDQAQSLAASTVHDSTHSEVEAGLSKLREAMKEAPRVAGLLFSGAAAAREYAAKL